MEIEKFDDKVVGDVDNDGTLQIQCWMYIWYIKVFILVADTSDHKYMVDNDKSDKEDFNW